MNYAPNQFGTQVGTCGKAVRDYGCGSDQDCYSNKCTVAVLSTATNYYSGGAYRSCAPRNVECMRNEDCSSGVCIGEW
jgi:hypothetical protein